GRRRPAPPAPVPSIAPRRLWYRPPRPDSGYSVNPPAVPADAHPARPPALVPNLLPPECAHPDGPAGPIPCAATTAWFPAFPSPTPPAAAPPTMPAGPGPFAIAFPGPTAPAAVRPGHPAPGLPGHAAPAARLPVPA